MPYRDTKLHDWQITVHLSNHCLLHFILPGQVYVWPDIKVTEILYLEGAGAGLGFSGSISVSDMMAVLLLLLLLLPKPPKPGDFFPRSASRRAC